MASQATKKKRGHFQIPSQVGIYRFSEDERGNLIVVLPHKSTLLRKKKACKSRTGSLAIEMPNVVKSTMKAAKNGHGC